VESSKPLAWTLKVTADYAILCTPVAVLFGHPSKMNWTYTEYKEQVRDRGTGLVAGDEECYTRFLGLSREKEGRGPGLCSKRSFRRVFLCAVPLHAVLVSFL